MTAPSTYKRHAANTGRGGQFAEHNHTAPSATLAESNTITVAEAHTLARDLIREHGLDGWKVRWTNARERFGSCSHRTQTINLSRPHTEANSRAQVQDTILHEIAHALAGPGAGHGLKWKAIALRIGATPKASSKSSSLPEHLGIPTGDTVGGIAPGDTVFVNHSRFRGQEFTAVKLDRYRPCVVKTADGTLYRVKADMLLNASGEAAMAAPDHMEVAVGVLVKGVGRMPGEQYRVLKVNPKTIHVENVDDPTDIWTFSKSMAERA